MTQQTAILTLHLGYPSAYTLGLSSATPSDPVPEQLDLLNDGLIVLQSGGRSGWTPTIAAPKSGVWADSATQEGRTLLAMPVGNATEQLSLVAADRVTAYTALREINRYGQRARDFWAGQNQQPVYVEWKAVDAPGSQYALIYSLDASFESFEPLVDAENNNVVMVAVSFEREAAWRGIPPGVSPKIWAMSGKRGLTPTGNASPSASQYNWDNLDLGAGAGNYAPLATATIRQGDELGTANVNYITIPAADVVGDAPALCQITWNPTGISPQVIDRVWIGKTTRTDLFPNNNTTGVLANARARSVLCAGDATLGAVANVTLTKPITADGWLSNGSIANRYVVSAVFAAGAAGNTNALRWTRRYSQYGGNYGIFMRHTVTAGTASDISVRVTANLPGGTTIQLDNVRLNNTLAVGRGNVIFLGTLNVPYSRHVDTNGTGVNTTEDIIFNLIFTKTAATTPTLLIWDIATIPLDEGAVLMDSLSGGAISTSYYDTTGYLSLTNSQNSILRRITGQPITLTPRVDNRLYFYNSSTAGTFTPAANMSAAVDIVPRWYGVRDA